MSGRAQAMQGFLDSAGWGAATHHHLAGDASDRRYERLTMAGQCAVLMDNPPGGADDPAAFVLIARHLSGLGLSAPRIMAADTAQGFLLLEDLGDALFARLLAQEPSREKALYTVATDALIHLQRAPAPADLPDLTAAQWAGAAAFALDWYAFAATGAKPDPVAFTDALTEALQTHADGPRVLILRDYHAENLLWLPDRQGAARAGLLDFQLGQMGQPAYDLVSLLQDARRDVAPAIVAAMTARFAAATGASGIDATFATLGAQRALRILGVFARLALVAGKPAYLALMPRVWGQLQANLSHPALKPLAKVCTSLLPPPTAPVLERIARQCGTHPTP